MEKVRMETGEGWTREGEKIERSRQGKGRKLKEVRQGKGREWKDLDKAKEGDGKV